MSLPSESNKQIAEMLNEAFAGKAKIFSQKHEEEELEITILQTENSPEMGLASIGTIGLSDTPMLQDGEEFSTRLELVGICQIQDLEAFQAIISAPALHLMQTNSMFYPGLVLTDLVKEFIPDTTVPHLYFTAPALWESLIDTQLADKRVNWLWAFPISESEFQFLQEKGDTALEDELANKSVDVVDFYRDTVV